MSRLPVARRRFIGGAVGLLVTAPLWLRTAFADEPTCRRSIRTLASLGAAFHRAHATGKRLLVFVIPASDEHKYERGQVFGAWLNHGTDAELAPLSLSELAAATMADLRTLVPKAPDGEPLMVLVDPSALDRPGIAIDPVLPALASSATADEGMDWDQAAQEQEKRENAAWDARIAVLSRAARVALAPGLSFPDDARAAASVKSRWVEGRVPGTHWARASGCGTSVEGVESNVAIGCGMGHVPERAKRFLYLFAKAPYEGEDLPE